jgi:hypothetical protein
VIKFNKFNVTKDGKKARVHYSLDNHTKHPLCVTIYARDHVSDFCKIFGADVIDNSDIFTDYMEKGRVTLTPGHELYEAARARAVANAEANRLKCEARHAKWAAAIA